MPDSNVTSYLQAGAPLRTVMHAGGAIADALLPRQTSTGARIAFAAKASGAAHLLQLTAASPLGGVQLFSSISGTLGNAGQANYAAANASLDCMASELQARLIFQNQPADLLLGRGSDLCRLTRSSASVFVGHSTNGTPSRL